MAGDPTSAQTPIPIHVGLQAPSPEPRAHFGLRNRPPRVMPYDDVAFDWAQHGLEPRWLGTETSDCASALDPRNYHNSGAEEQDRFLAGTRTRGETALVIATMGDGDYTEARMLGATADASISIPDFDTHISGAHLPSGATVTLATGLTGADRDLGLRIQTNNTGRHWWRIQMSGAVWTPGGGGPSTVHQPNGELHPILVDGLGQPVVAVWTPEHRDERWYIVPHGCEYHTILDWLVTRALPEYVPGALRRARSSVALDPTLQTPAEAAAQAALRDLQANYETQRAALQQQLDDATAAASGIREGLLFGTGTVLEDAVQAVIEAAGLTVVRVDALLAATASADLLVMHDNERRLVEVKSAAGNVGENLVSQLENHLRTWPQLQPSSPVGGGILIVNHQHRLDPSERASRAYERPEFVQALTVPVITTPQLFEWWRNSEWDAVTRALFPDHNPLSSASGTRARSAPPGTTSIGDPSPRSRRRRFRRQNQG
jgi:hypothetical protein